MSQNNLRKISRHARELSVSPPIYHFHQYLRWKIKKTHTNVYHIHSYEEDGLPMSPLCEWEEEEEDGKGGWTTVVVVEGIKNTGF